MSKKLTNEEFIEKAKLIHGDRYDYSLVEYINNDTKVKIICKEHDVFEQNPNAHLISKGCSSCCGNKKSNSEEFIKKAKLIHGDKYDYSKVNYTGVKNKVDIICDKHDIFSQTPNTHLSGHGCKKCGNKNHIDFFIERSINIYGNKYTYDNVIYDGINSLISITCPKHGDFMTTAHYFLYSETGCTYCSLNSYKDITFFIEDAIKIHGDKFKYEVIDDLNKLSYIKIICPNHGNFTQRISSHLEGIGCKKCSDDAKRNNLDSLIILFNKKHNNKYDYSLVEYINTNKKVKIICPEHGEFLQRTKQHLRGEGCKRCYESKGEREIFNFLISYDIKYEFQYTFKDCKNINMLPFDFYLPDYNICIEYDGIQHFEVNEFFGGEDGFAYRKINDNIKTNYCLDNNINLLRIPYYDFEKINEIIIKYINNGN